VSGAEVSDGEGGIDRDEVECAIANMIYKVRSLPFADSLQSVPDICTRS
jgi:hypothetical protein